MSKQFKQKTPNYKAPTVETPYTRAKKEWDNRFGSVVARAANWRLVAILSVTTSLILLILLIANMMTNKNKVLVAEVEHSGRIVNIVPLQKQYQPSIAQEEYFVVHFIKLIRELPLDPVVAKNNWYTAYNFLTQRSTNQLNTFLKKNNPIKLLGKQTITVAVTDINQISNNTFQVDWNETVTDADGQQNDKSTVNSTTINHKFSGIFTIALKQPISQQQILQNPLGIYIIDFNISQREA